MVVYERQKEIIEYLKKNRFATVKELSALVWSSEASVRRDIKALEQKGYLKQIYGGVVLPEYENSVVPVGIRESAHSPVKDKLAQRAAEHIFDGATVFIDGSSTARRIIKYIGSVKKVNVITNNIRVFNENELPNVKIYCTGGLFLPQNNTFVGASAQRYVSEINADILFFSSQAISDDGEISDACEEETALRRVMLSKAKKKIFICDSSKIGEKRTFSVCTKDDVDIIICDKKLPWEK